LSGFGIGLLLLVALSVIAQFMLAAEAEEGFSPYPGIGMFVAGLLLTPGAFLLGLLGGAIARGRASSKRVGESRNE
jgi:hypothetical protein